MLIDNNILSSNASDVVHDHKATTTAIARTNNARARSQFVIRDVLIEHVVKVH